MCGARCSAVSDGRGPSCLITTATCLALLSEMYTTTALSATDSLDGTVQKRIRLTYKSSPIADFGVTYGSFDAPNEDRLAYFDVSDGTFYPGQDPADHYWIYFTTIKGDRILFDCGLFTFNMCDMVVAQPYNSPELPPLDFAPAFFRERTLDRSLPDLHTERRSMSVLRNDSLGRAMLQALHGGGGDSITIARAVSTFMEGLTARTVPMSDVAATVGYTKLYCDALALNLETEAWKKWPQSPQRVIEQDPGQLDDAYNEEESWFEYMKKWRAGSRTRKSLLLPL
ncbi:hypothetical protein B0H16DRAFT_1032959 [Mycena metata]|uniref:Uncharacterized protein n=1 Tax=Mycena metata TaxID=1033252 RepID=A0AAD7N167_9AGAR|nr:hypothetical protein B0H16DRAFT_1032959 [Mycena metata]